LVETIDSVLRVLNDRSDCEILILDNNSSDQTSTIKSKYSLDSRIKYFLEINQGLSHARNRGVKESKGEILIFLDDDIDFVDDYFSVCDIIYKNNKVDIVGGKVLPYNTDIPYWLPKEFYYLVSIYDPGNEFSKIDSLMGANYSMRKTVALNVGGYNTELGRKGNSLMGGEESEFLSRAKDKGYDVYYDPSLIVLHKINDKLNTKYVLNYAFLNGKSTAVYYKQYWGNLRFVLKLIRVIFDMLLFYYTKFSSKKTLSFMRRRIKYNYSRGFLNKK